MRPASCCLFVYGSLRRGFHHPAYGYISEYFHYEGDATTQGRLHDLGQYPAAVPAKDGLIVGELYRIREEDQFSWAIAQLDDYEGVHAEEGEVQEYKRELTTVHAGGREVTAWIYWYAKPVEGFPVVPSGDVLEYYQSRQGGAKT
jgi:gamma-glutamylcyclotransferase (GGCT)/AIG2-like uncharacterized protein YtfP